MNHAFKRRFFALAASVAALIGAGPLPAQPADSGWSPRSGDVWVDAWLGDINRYGARYRGWLPNARAPEIFARHLATVHVPRRFYVDMLHGRITVESELNKGTKIIINFPNLQTK